MRIGYLLLIGLAWAIALGGCAAGRFGASMEYAGVTTGGAQDTGLARNQIAAGQIPRPEAFVVEGFLGEHDIDVEGPACERRFCLQTTSGVAPALDTGRDAAFVVLGFSSGIELDSFRRRPLNLSVVIDRSGSMRGGKIAAVRTALRRLVGQLNENDRLSIVLFNQEVQVLWPSRPVNPQGSALMSAIDNISAGGSTDIERGLAQGYAQVIRYHDAQRENRVMVFTDARPNSGRTDRDSFLGLARTHAQHGIGLTAFGVGLDFGQELALDISQVPGANYFYLDTVERLTRVFDEDFDLLVTPVAWDFAVDVRPSPGFRIAAAYGVPERVQESPGGAIRIRIPTLFLSRNRGAIVLRLEPDEELGMRTALMATTHLGYRDQRSQPTIYAEGRIETPETLTTYDRGVGKAVALVNTALGLRSAARLAHSGRHPEALAILDRVDQLLGNDAYNDERRVVADLRALISAHVSPIRPGSPARDDDESQLYGPNRESSPRWIR